MSLSVLTGVAAFAPRLLDALLAADRDGAHRAIAEAVRDSGDGVAVIDELLAGVMYDVGRLWEEGQITIADEHMATAIAHSTLTGIYPSLVSAPERSRGVVLLAGADGEQHLFGLRMIADVLEGAGFDVRNTAGSLPPPALAAAVTRHRPVLIGLAQTVGEPAPMLACIAAVRTIDPEVPILLGGSAVDAAVAGAAGARVQTCGSARATLEAARRLTSAATA